MLQGHAASSSDVAVSWIYPEDPALTPKHFPRLFFSRKIPFPLWADPSQMEVLFQRKVCDELYQWQASNLSKLSFVSWWYTLQTQNMQGPLFVLHDGPPHNRHFHVGTSGVHSSLHITDICCAQDMLLTKSWRVPSTTSIGDHVQLVHGLIYYQVFTFFHVGSSYLPG